MATKEKRWNLDKSKLSSKEIIKIHARYDAAKQQMSQRTYHHELYGLLAKNKSIHDYVHHKKESKQFSEGSTQHILRKILADTIQRVPDGELVTQYDRHSKEAILLQYIFDNKIMESEIEGADMMSNLTKAFKMSWIYAFAPVRTGFESDIDGEPRVKFSLEQWSDVFINPDCTDICQAKVVYHRSYMSKDDVLELINEDGSVKDSTYNEDTIHFVIDEDLFSSKDAASETMSDKMKGSTSSNSLELITEYRRGAKEFTTFVPKLNAKFRTVPNYDPRKGIPWNFLVLEPDADFPIGVSQVEFLLGDQQFNDLFQTSAYKNLMLAMEPPIKVGGWETNPSSYKFEPRKIWNLGNNPNNVQVEPVKIENSILTGWTETREAVAASMMRSLNAADGTIAADAGANYSKTAPGVEQQTNNKTISINQYQKRVETFIQDWASQALRMYINSMGGEHEIVVDEETRRRLVDIDESAIINGNKVTINFDELSIESAQFKVRSGSLVQKKEDQELDRITTVSQPIIQNINGWSEQNRMIIENDVLLPLVKRMLELSGVDIANTLSESLSSQIAKNMMSDMQGQIDNQQMQLDGMQAQMDAQQPQENLAQGPAEPLAPMQQENPDNPAVINEGEEGVAEPSSPSPDDMGDMYDDLLSM